MTDPLPPLDLGALYEVLAESTPDTIISIDEGSRVLSLNQAGERLFGYSAAEVIGRPLTDLMPERMRTSHHAGFARYLATGQRHFASWKGVRIAILTRDGREVPVEISFGEFISGGRRVFSGIMRDITEHLAAEAAIAEGAERLQQQAMELEQQVEESQATAEELEQANEELHTANRALEEAADVLRTREEEFRALANSIPTLSWMARPDGWIFWYNDRWYEYTGTTPGQMEGWGWQRVHDPAVLPAVMTEWTRAIATGQPFEMTFPLLGADGVFRAFLTRVSPLRDAKGEVLRWFGTNTNIEHEHVARRTAERAAARMRLLQDLTALLANARTVDDVASVTVAQAVEVTRAATGMLALIDAAAGEAVIIRQTGLPASIMEQYGRQPLDAPTPSAQSMRERRPLFIGTRDGPDGLLARFPSLRDVWPRIGTQAIASVPLVIGTRLRGAMAFTFDEPQPFGPDEQELFLTLAGQVAQALERVEAFAAEQRERRRNESIVESITDGFATFDAALHFTYVNARASAMFGVSRGELLGRSVTSLARSEGSPFVETIREVIASRVARSAEAFGTILGRWLDMRVYPAEDGGATVYFQDITERRRRQDAASFLAEASRVLASSTDHRQTLLNLARAAVPRLGEWCAIDLLDDPDSTLVPPAVTRVTLVHEDPKKLELADEFQREYPPDWSGQRPNAVADALRGEAILIPEITDDMLTAGAVDERHLQLLRMLGLMSAMIVPLMAGGRALGAITIVSGESGRKYNEDDLALAKDLAGRAATAVEHSMLLERAEAANVAKTEFLRTMSHELRQPLNAMGGLLQLWEMGLRGNLSEAQQSDLERIKRNQHQLATMIEDLLSFARLEAGRLEVEKQAVNVDAVLGALDPLVALDLESHGVAYEYRRCDTELAVLGDMERIHQVLVNLVTNAIRAMPDGGRVTVSCRPDGADGRFVAMEVADTGVGIPADRLESIFVPFVQLGRALNQPREGVGLGLAISKALAEAMNGTLTVTSVVGTGSTFVLSLPRVR